MQSNAPSIQDLIEKALTTALRQKIALVGSGRTDAGVHARGQVAHFVSPAEVDSHKLLASLNGLLPTEIRILSIDPVDAQFHARYSAASKIYHYYVHLSPITDPFRRHYSYHVRWPIDISLMRQAAKECIGTHDFSSFSHEAHKGAAAKNPVRTLHRLDISESNGLLCLEFEGEGFLYKMVRNIVGTLLDVGSGKISVESMKAIFAAKDRSKAGQTAPAHGLFLMQVHYPSLRSTNKI